MSHLTASGAPGAATCRDGPMSDAMQPTDLDAFWMPFTPNRQFTAAPRLVVSAEGIAYRTADGRRALDGTSGLWCVGAGHRHPRIAQAMKAQIDTLDFASNFQVGHPGTAPRRWAE